MSVDVIRYYCGMGRWEPDARGRLEQAALELYGEHGFEATTVAEIAERAGLTERTFFRYFADKREVLFWGAAELREMLEREVRDAPAELDPMAAVVAALQAVARILFEERRARVRQRQAIVLANTELRERELIKLATLSEALTRALGARGVFSASAHLAAEAGIVVLKVAFERWVSTVEGQDLSAIIAETAGELQAVAAGEPVRAHA